MCYLWKLSRPTNTNISPHYRSGQSSFKTDRNLEQIAAEWSSFFGIWFYEYSEILYQKCRRISAGENDLFDIY